MRITAVSMNSRIENLKFKSKNPKNGNLFVRFKSSATVLTKDGYKHAKPGDFIFYDRTEEIEYTGEECVFVHDFFRFFIDDEKDELFSIETSRLFSFPLSDRAEDILRLIDLEHHSASKTRECALDLLGKLFFLILKEAIDNSSTLEKTPKYEELLSLRCEMLSSPERDFTIDSLAQRMFMSPTLFQKTYKKCFGKSCILDLIQARINKASYLLRYTSKKETEIAALCGYNNVEHFIRQFKKHKGITPSKYRRNS